MQLDLLEHAPQQRPHWTAEERALLVVAAAQHQTMGLVVMVLLACTVALIRQSATVDAVPVEGDERGAVGEGVHCVQLLIALRHLLLLLVCFWE